jgi:hypothetical protein
VGKGSLPKEEGGRRRKGVGVEGRVGDGGERQVGGLKVQVRGLGGGGRTWMRHQRGKRLNGLEWKGLAGAKGGGEGAVWLPEEYR